MWWNCNEFILLKKVYSNIIQTQCNNVMHQIQGNQDATSQQPRQQNWLILKNHIHLSSQSEEPTQNKHGMRTTTFNALILFEYAVIFCETEKVCNENSRRVQWFKISDYT